jgi:predicted DNA-binding protein (MmcQ/YjbR family)
MRCSALVPSDDPLLDRIRAICLRFPDAEEAALQDRPLFRVASRRFAIYNGDDSPPRPRWQGAGPSLHVLTDPAERPALSQDPRFRPSPHHGDRGWLAFRLDTPMLDWQEVAELLESAYRQAAGRSRLARLDRDR